jgi:hypothetical protein
MDERLLLLLEDNPDRLRPMLEVLALMLPRHRVQVEDDASSAINWFATNQAYVELISLDHDLDSVPRHEAVLVDHGCGRDVSRFLATCVPSCPVIVHTTNVMAGTDMQLDLRRAGWIDFRVYPFDGHAWVDKTWRDTIQSLITRGYLTV